jgi:hypothetical protein
MNLLIVLCTSIVVWLNRGLYDPSVPILVALFLAWSYGTVANKNWLKKLDRGFLYLPVVWAILFIFKNDFLYVPDLKKAAVDLVRFFPLLGVTIYALSIYAGMPPRKANRGIVIVIALLILVPFLSPEPHIDVFLSNRLGAHFLLKGANPYSAIYPDIYKSEFDYKAGFLYWPGALILQTISEFLLHDIRWVLIFAWIGAALLLKTRKQYFFAWLTIPFLPFALEQAWLDPLIALGAALTLYGLRTNKHLWWILGAVLAATVKQYGFMIGLFSLLYFIRENGFEKARGILIWMGIGFILVVAPFVWLDPQAFLDMTVLSHLGAHVRPDALNFTAFWLKMTGQELPGLLQLGFILVGLAFASLHIIKNRISRGLKTIPEAWAIFFGFSIFFGKFAFANYFLLMISFWLMAESEGDGQVLIWRVSPPSSNEVRLVRKSRFF